MAFIKKKIMSSRTKTELVRLLQQMAEAIKNVKTVVMALTFELQEAQLAGWG
jgi:hypothetical protein